MLPHSFLQLQCFQCSLEEESDRVQAEHDARPAFLALDFLARLRSTVPVRAPPAAPAHSSPHCSPSTTSTPPRVLAPAPSSLPGCAGTPPTHARTGDRAGVCALCFGLALECASGFVVEPTRLCHCFGRALRAWNHIRLEHGGGQCSQLCHDDQRQSRQHVHQASSDVSVVSPFCHRLSHLPLRSLLRLAFARRRHLEVHRS